MADVSNKTKLQLGSGFVKPPTSPSTPTKLLINHGKPNFTIQRSPKADDENRKTFTLTNGNNNTNNKENNSQNFQNGEVVVKNTKFYGALNTVATKEAKIPAAQTEEEKGYGNVVLRRTPAVPPVTRKEGEENVPEFILRQRAIQERLAKENLDFENRRSGYFTQVHMSPTKPSPTSFVETMSSPAIVPGLEIPPPTFEKSAEKQTSAVEEQAEKVEQIEQPKEQVESKVENVEHVEHEQKIEPNEQAVVEDKQPEVKEIEEEKVESVVEHKEEQKVEHVEEQKTEVAEQHEQVESKVNGHVNDEEVANVIEEINKAVAGEDVETKSEDVKPAETFEVPVQHNYHPLDYQNEVQVVHAHEEATKTDENNNEGEQITISHTNGLEKPHVAEADPSGALGVNFEPKTVVSFSKDLGAGDNKYPDTVVVEKTLAAPVNEELKALNHVKFDIKEDDEGIQVTPVVKAEN